MMHRIEKIKAVVFALVVVLLAACGGKKEADPRAMIAGNPSKVWKIDRQESTAGDKIRLSGSDKAERVQFYSDGKFTINTPTESQSGQWVYEPGAKTLSLQFEGTAVTENFTVEKLDDNEMKLNSPMAGTLLLDAE